MKLQANRRNLVKWNLSGDPASSYESRRLTRFARTRRIRRCVRTGALLTAIGLVRLARGLRSRWRPLVTGAVLTVGDVLLFNGAWDLILVAALLFFVYPVLFAASSDADRKRRYELERELPIYSIPVDCHQIVWPQ